MNLDTALKNINLKELEAFLAVADTLSFSEAAKKMGISQPSISVKIKSLESRYNKTLFIREGRKVVLTSDGQKLAVSVREMFEGLVKLTNTITEPSKEDTIRISVGEAIFLYAFQHMLENYRKVDPKVHFRTIIGDTQSNIESLENEETDVAFVGWVGRDRLHSGRLKIERIGYDELVLIAPVGHELAQKGKVSIKDILKYPYVARKPNSGVQKTVTEIIKVNGISLNDVETVAVFDNASSVIMAVFRELGVSIVSRLQATTAEKIGLIKIIPLEERVSRRPVFAITRKKPTPEINRFFDFCVDFLRKNMEGELHQSRT